MTELAGGGSPSAGGQYAPPTTPRYLAIMPRTEQGSSEHERPLAVPGGRPVDSRAERRAARARIGAYHETKLAELIEHVRQALARYDAGEIDVFDLDDVIHHYKRAARELWKFCSGTGSDVLFAARTLDFWEAEEDFPDWWQAGAQNWRRRA